MVAMDTPMLTTARPQLAITSQATRSCTRASFRPALLRVSCCSGATPRDGGSSGAAVSRGERRDGSGAEVAGKSSARFGTVYVASVPLRAPKGAAEVLQAVQDVQLLADFQHFMTIIKPNDDAAAPCTVLDFQPRDPENPITVVNVLLGNTIPGDIKERTLSKLPNKKCWLIGEMKSGLSLEDALEFSRGYNSVLNLGVNDCRHYTMDLVEFLTGKHLNFIEEVRNVKGREMELAEELRIEKILSGALGDESQILEKVEEPAEEATVKTSGALGAESQNLEKVEEPAEEATVKTSA